jgi:hypothetical protein
MAGARGAFGEAEIQSRRRLRHAPQDFERGRHDLGSDPVAGKNGDMEGGIGGHGRLPFLDVGR